MIYRAVIKSSHGPSVYGRMHTAENSMRAFEMTYVGILYENIHYKALNRKWHFKIKYG